MKTMIAAAAMALSLTAGAAAAQQPGETESRRDLICMALFLAIADSDDPQMIQAGSIGSLFFYGRLQGREPQANWLERLAVLSEEMTLEQLYARGAECGSIVERVGQDMVAYAEQYEAAQ